MKQMKAANLGILASILESHPQLWEKIGPHVEKALEAALKAMSAADKKVFVDKIGAMIK